MKLICKSTVNREELQYKRSLGFKAVEIHLLSWDDMIDIDFLHSIGFELVNIHGVIEKGDAILFEDLANDEKVSRIVGFLERTHVHTYINLVVHSENNLPEKEFLKAVETLEMFYEKYNTKVLIENSSMLKISGSRGLTLDTLYTPNGIPDLVKKINQTSKIHGLVYSLLDTTHAMSSIRVAKLFNYGEEYTLEDYVKAYSSTIHTCHLANCVGYGIGAKFHGVGFQEYEDDLKYHLGLFEKYWGNMPNIVLEFSEEDYFNCVNLIHCKNYISSTK